MMSSNSSSAAVRGSLRIPNFDSVGNRLQRTSMLPGVVATGLLNYDANDRTSTDPYDPNGNLLSSGAGSNAYDFENRLVQAGGVQIVYDGDGNRVNETVATTTTSYLVADQNLTGYAQVLDQLQGRAVSRTYSYGLQLISQSLTWNAQGPTFYGFDGHGSVRFLTSSTGAITDTYDYDAFGKVISHTGTTANNYLFAGKQFDPALGVYYNRARYYDQRPGRFWTMDTWEGSNRDPVSLHKYLYTSANPVNRIDPSGREDIAEATFVAGEENTVSAEDAEVKNEARKKVVDELKPVILIHATSAEQAKVIDTFGLSAQLYPDVGDIQGKLTGAFFVIRPAANPQFAFQALVQFAAAFAEGRFTGQPLAAMVGELPQAVFDTLRLEGAIVNDYLGGVLGDACLPASFATLDEFNLGRWVIIPLGR
jgi:RHS repeat-associated protein